MEGWDACRMQHACNTCILAPSLGSPRRSRCAPLRRSSGVTSTTACRSSLRVHTTMGLPRGGRVAPPPPLLLLLPTMASPRRTTTSCPAPMLARAWPTRPPPTITNGCAAKDRQAGEGRRHRVEIIWSTMGQQV